MYLNFRLSSAVFVGLLLFFVSGLYAKTQLNDGNSLNDHASPYLAMHGGDPVNWQVWSEATVALAKRQNKLLFVSSGYFSCHWCHVMQRESYQNKEIAAIINKHFIAVKVDRELNPALDARLINFAERTTGSAGWPLNVFVTPDGYPIVAMTYVPAQQFSEILVKIYSRWDKEAQELKKYAKAVANDLNTNKRTSDSKLPVGLAQKYIQVFQANAFDYADELQGGFGQSLKFPSASQLSLLLDIQKKSPNPRLEAFLRLTLDQMVSQGLWDQIGGGFYRYVIDPAWQVPHFEKMLYNNALLAPLYFDAAKILNNPQYKKIAISTLDFMIRDFSTVQDALAASLSSVDDKGIEGGFYVWQRQEIKKLVTADEFNIAELIWGLNNPPSLEHGFHLTQKISFDDLAKALKRDKKQLLISYNKLRQKLFEYRKNRSCPKDDKQLAAWNGLALSAFVKGAVETAAPRFSKQALAIKTFIESNLWHGDQLSRAVKDKKPIGIAGLEDYAYVSQGFYDYARYSQQKSDLNLAYKIVQQGFKRFYTKFGWVLSENMLLKFGKGQAILTDGPMPAAASLLAAVALRVSKIKKNADLKDLALASLNVEHKLLATAPFWYATHVKAIAEYQLNW